MSIPRTIPIAAALTALILSPLTLSATRLSLPDISIPPDLHRSTLELEIQHRFYGVLTQQPLSTFAGVDYGADVSLGLRYVPFAGLDASVSHIRDHQEYTIGTGYSRTILDSLAQGRADLRYFSYREPGSRDRHQNLFYQVSLQGRLPGGRVEPVLAAGYDGDNRRAGVGLGLQAVVARRVGLLEEVSLMGEYFPVVRNSSPSLALGDRNSFAFGIGLRTWGHQFVLMAGNSTAIGMRRLMLGSNANDLHLGFSIRRILKGG